MQKICVVARNGSGRPMLQHRIYAYADIETACGVYIANWTREFSSRVFHPILACKRCAEIRS